MGGTSTYILEAEPVSVQSGIADPHAEARELLSNEFGQASVIPNPGRGGARLSDMQRLFAAHFVLNGGQATKAAAVAGYGSPHTSGVKNMVNPTVLAEIKRLCIINLSSYLPHLIRAGLEIIADPAAPAVAKVQMIKDLLDRGGMAIPRGGPQVNVQINMDGQQAQAIIAEVHSERQKRLSHGDGA